MLKIAAGAILGGATYYVTRHALLSAGVLAITGIVCNIIYAQRLNGLLGGADPVATFGARSLGELKAAISIPGRIQFLEFFAKSCGWAIVAVAILWFQSPTTLSPEDESNLENVARAYEEKRLATREFNDAIGSEAGVVTVPKNTVDQLIDRYERALQLSKATNPEVLDRVPPELVSEDSIEYEYEYRDAEYEYEETPEPSVRRSTHAMQSYTRRLCSEATVLSRRRTFEQQSHADTLKQVRY